MRAYVGITDWDWYQQLRAIPGVGEINFWKPGGKHRFGALQPGELFLFKLHSPRNFVVGGGFFTYSTILPVSLAWESFLAANGAASFEEMRRRIAQYRKSDPTSPEDYSIGCILLARPFFLPEREWIPVPSDWNAAIQQGKRYDLEQEPGASLFQRIRHALWNEAATRDGSMQLGDTSTDLADRYGTPVLVAPRLGQGAFRVMVTDAYERRCAMTGEKVLPVLQAAHIRPFAQEGPHRVQNGILLRSDLHTLFDRGYVTVASDLRLEVSRRLHEDFENGRDYYALHGHPLRVPASTELRPAGEFLSWHSENVYRG